MVGINTFFINNWQFGSIAQRRKRIYAYVTASQRAGQLLCSSSYPVEAVRIVDR
ncbi:hypothetical protein J6590_053768 [Homalodisca vitripennis]|nr:hypothetical protein J6590_053768 [Homalodisca vitripennis]